MIMLSAILTEVRAARHRLPILLLFHAGKSKFLFTASADGTAKIWMVETGKDLVTIPHRGTVKCICLSEDEKRFATITDPFGMEVDASVRIYAFDKENPSAPPTLLLEFAHKPEPRVKMTRLAWLPGDEALLVSFEDGSLRRFDPDTGKQQGEWKHHEGAITCMAFNDKKTLMATSSSDRSAKLWDVSLMQPIKTFKADVPLNGAAISPILEHVIAGGGQEAMSVTTTAVSAGKFETRFYHMVFEHELGRVKGHFGPINTLAFHPDGRSFCSGAEDGYVRLHVLDTDYYTLGDEDQLDDPVLSRALSDGTYAQLEAEEEERKKAEEEAAAARARAGGGAGGGAGAGAGIAAK